MKSKPLLAWAILAAGFGVGMASMVPARASSATAVARAGAGGRASATARAGATSRAATASQSATTKSALYTDFVERYISSRWDNLATDLAARQKEFNALPVAQRDDIAYIKTALGECRPGWWDQVKKGDKIPILATVWTRPMNLTFEPNLQAQLGFVVTNNSFTLTVGWPTDTMDNPEKIQGPFSKGDQMSETIWGQLANAEVVAILTPQKMSALPPDQKMALDRFIRFRGALSALYFGTPEARRFMAMQGTGSFSANYNSDISMVSKRIIGSLFLADWAANTVKYPSIKIPMDFSTLPRDQQEGWLAGFVCAQLLSHQLTFAEDKQLRDVAKALVNANGTTPADTGKITLANKLEVALDPAKDSDLAAKRYTWLWEKLTKKEAATTQAGRGTTTRATTTRAATATSRP